MSGPGEGLMGPGKNQAHAAAPNSRRVASEQDSGIDTPMHRPNGARKQIDQQLVETKKWSGNLVLSRRTKIIRY